jgi:hypothetical protein
MRIHEIIGIACFSDTVGILVCNDYPPLKIAQNASPRSKMQEVPRCFNVWDLSSPAVGKPSQHAWGEIQKMKKTSITDHAGALMGLTGPRSGGCSGYAAWKKPRPNIWKH